MKINTIYCLIACALTAGFAKADDINQTISVTKENEAVERKAVKPELFPTETSTETKKVTLDFSDWAIPASVNPDVVVSTPQSQYDGFNFRCRRGYAYFGAGNYLNMTASAGYRILESRKANLAIWLQHNSTNGNISNPLQFEIDPGYSDMYVINNGLRRKQFVIDDRIGLDLSNHLNAGTLSTKIGYHYSKFNYFGAAEPALIASDYDNDYRQKVNDIAVSSRWDGATDGSLAYHAAIDYNFLGFADPIQQLSATSALKGMKEHDININLGAEVIWDVNSHAGINLNYRRLGYSNALSSLDINPYVATFDSKNSSIFTVEPYYRKATQRLNLLLGARIDIADKGTTLRVAPDINFDYSFNNRIALQLEATGGNRLNSVHSIFERNRYVAPSMAYEIGTYTLADARLSLNVGPFRGLSFSPFIGFAVVRNAQIPVLYSYNTANSITPSVATVSGAVEYMLMDRDGLNAGIAAQWKWRSVIDLKAKYTYTPQSDNLANGYILNDDLARHNFTASMQVSPIKQLDVIAQYNFRSERTLLVMTETQSALAYYNRLPLGVVSDLSLGATYRINDIVRVFAQGNNILNRRWQEYLGMRNQGIGFIIGVGAQF